MSRPQRARVQIIHVMRMEYSRLLTSQDDLLAGRVGQPVDAPLPSIAHISSTRGADDRHTLRQHHLISGMGMQVPTAHEAGLGGVGVDPAEDHEVGERVDVVEEVGLVGHLAGVGGGGLARHDEFADEEGIGEEGASEEGAGFEVEERVGGGEGEEGVAQGGGEEEGAERGAVFEVGRWFEGVGWLWGRGGGLGWVGSGRDGGDRVVTGGDVGCGCGELSGEGRSGDGRAKGGFRWEIWWWDLVFGFPCSGIRRCFPVSGGIV